MKTVKEYICTLDADRIVDMYFYKYSDTLSGYYYGRPLSDKKDERISTMTITEFVKDLKERINEYIDYLKSIDITPSKDGKQGIIYAYNKLEGYHYWSDTLCTALVHLDELKKDPENCEDYCYMLTKFSEILGFLVADNQYTQGNIYEVIADVMHEASWCGYRQERLEQQLESLKKADEDFEKQDKESYISADELFKDLLGEEGFKEMEYISYHETDEEEELRHAAMDARYKYEHYSQVKERKMILEALKG